MTATTSALTRRTADGVLSPFPVAASEQILAGWPVVVGKRGSGTGVEGHAKTLTAALGTAGTHELAGIADEDADNSATGPLGAGSAGAINAKVRVDGCTQIFVGSSFTDADHGKDAWIIDNQTAQTTPTAAGFYGGKVVEVISSTQIRVKLPAYNGPSVAGKQTIAMADGQVALLRIGTAGAGETMLTGRTLFVDAESTGATEDLLLPPEAQCTDLVLTVINTGDEIVCVKEDSDTTVIADVRPGAVAIFTCDGTTWRGGVMSRRGVIGRIIADSAAAGTSSASEADFDATLSIPAGLLKTGDVVRITGSGYYNATHTTDTGTIKAYLGSTAIWTSSAVDVADNDTFSFSCLATIRTNGATGTAHVEGMGVNKTTATSSSVAIASIDTTAALTVKSSVTFSASDAGNAAKLRSLVVELL